MAILKINPSKLEGECVNGFALDYHSVSSVPTNDPAHPFDTKRTELGEHLFQFKYRNNSAGLDDIVDTVDDFVRRWNPGVDCICTAPHSIGRARQPVAVLADLLSQRLGLPIINGATEKTKITQPMKNVTRTERAAILAEAIVAGAESVDGKSVLLLDDLYDSGSTMARVCEILKEKKAKNVHGLAITRTRN
jgi:competence protein ComFC